MDLPTVSKWGRRAQRNAMRNIRLSDTTLGVAGYTFKEKLEIARLLDALRVDVLELPAMKASKEDEVLLRTMASFVRTARLSVAVSNADSLSAALDVLHGVEGAIIRVEVPVSTVGMEYAHQMKAPKMLQWVQSAVAQAKAHYAVEFCAVDATRAEPDFLRQIVAAAIEAGADWVSLTDEAGQILPDDFAALVGEIVQSVTVPVGVRCVDTIGLAVAQSALAVKAGASFVKTAVDGDYAQLDTMVRLLAEAGIGYGVACGVDHTRLLHSVNQIRNVRTAAVPTMERDTDSNILLNDKDDIETVMAAVAKIGYDLAEQDKPFVYEEFLRVAKKKKVGAKELSVIVQSVAMQYPAVYKLESYVINNGNIITSSAQITVTKDTAVLHGVSIGDGPVDAAFRALEQIVGAHYELDDFQIHAVTEGREAVGQAQVKLRAGGKVYIGNGVSTDIIGASIRAYLSAVNKIVYEGL